MSCYIVSKQHIDVLVRAVLVCLSSEYSADELGNILWRENHRSYNYRYSLRIKTPRYIYEYRYHHNGWIEDPYHLLKIVGNYDYQSCERPDYSKSKAGKLVKNLYGYIEALVGKSIGEIEEDPRWVAHPWRVVEYGEKE